MGIVLSESSHSKEPVKDAAPLIAINRTQFGPAKGEFPVRSQSGLIDHDMKWAVHRFQVITLLVNFNRRIHVVFVEPEMARCLPETVPADVRGIKNLVAAFPMPLAPMVFDHGSKPGALGVPENEPRAKLFGCAEEVEIQA
jgi:hypothetical protein